MPDTLLDFTDSWAISSELAKFLTERFWALGPRRAIECGSGQSTMLLAALAQQLGTQVISLEHDPTFLARTATALERHGLLGLVELVHAPLTHHEGFLWYDTAFLAEIPPRSVDFLLVDGPPGSTGPRARHPALPLLVDYLSERAEIVLDDAARADGAEIAERWARTFDLRTTAILGDPHGARWLRHV